MPEPPPVFSNNGQGATKTSIAMDILAAVGAMDDIIKAAESKNIWAGKDKMYNRLYTYLAVVCW